MQTTWTEMKVNPWIICMLHLIVIPFSKANDGTCTICPENFYCDELTSTPCPKFSKSPASSSERADCICSQGHVTLASGECEPEFVTQFEPQFIVTRVSFDGAVALTIAQFDTAERNTYKSGVARALSVPVYTVTIGSIREFQTTNRRLLAASVAIETIITVVRNGTVDPETAADAIVQAATRSNMNAALDPHGLAIFDMTTPRVTTVDLRDACTAGTFANHSQDYACTPCDKNTYSDAGMGICSNCPPLMISPIGSTRVQCMCNSQYIENYNTGLCELPGICTTADAFGMSIKAAADVWVAKHFTDYVTDYTTICHIDFIT
jgi:hypothetical protein